MIKINKFRIQMSASALLDITWADEFWAARIMLVARLVENNPVLSIAVIVEYMKQGWQGGNANVKEAQSTATSRRIWPFSLKDKKAISIADGKFGNNEWQCVSAKIIIQKKKIYSAYRSLSGSCRSRVLKAVVRGVKGCFIEDLGTGPISQPFSPAKVHELPKPLGICATNSSCSCSSFLVCRSSAVGNMDQMPRAMFKTKIMLRRVFSMCCPGERRGAGRPTYSKKQEIANAPLACIQ